MANATRFLTTALFLVWAAPLTAQPDTSLVPVEGIPGVLVQRGYDFALGIGGLNYPSGITFGEGRAWVSEAGFPGVAPTVKEVTLQGPGQGTALVVLAPMMLPPGTLMDPFTDVTYREGLIWLSHRQIGANDWLVGAISRFDPDDPAGTFVTVLTNLPSAGDHQTNALVFGADGRAYFGQGTATNSAVVGPDNVPVWVEMAPGFRDFAPVAITLNGDAFQSRVPTSLDPEADAVTAPFRPFDTGNVGPGTIIPAATPATPQEGIIAGVGTVYSFDPAAADAAGTLRLEAWGLRNPFGLAFDLMDSSRLFISNNGSDVRGQAGDPDDPFDPTTYVLTGNRPIAQDQDEMFEIAVGGDVEFFGWPDFFHDPATDAVLGVEDALFCQSSVLTAADCPRPVFDAAFSDGLTVAPAFGAVGLFVSVTGFEPSTSEAFGFVGDLFVTESGAFAPQTGAFEFTGYKVTRIDRTTGAEVDFVVNEGSTPEELLDADGFNKPVMAAFVGDTLAIVDLGVLEPGIDLFQSATGKVWLLSRRTGTAGEGGPGALDAPLLRAVLPNPAANSATVAFELPASAGVRLAVYDVLGRRVALVVDGPTAAGTHAATIRTDGLTPGVYVVRLEVDGRAQARQFTVSR